KLDGGLTLNGVARKSLEAVMDRIGAHLRKPRISPDDPEAYTVFQFTPADVGMEEASAWLEKHGRDVAGLITGEKNAARLSDAEIAETLRERFSYYRDDLVVIDWDAALVVDPGPAADVLRV